MTRVSVYHDPDLAMIVAEVGASSYSIPIDADDARVAWWVDYLSGKPLWTDWHSEQLRGLVRQHAPQKALEE